MKHQLLAAAIVLVLLVPQAGALTRAQIAAQAHNSGTLCPVADAELESRRLAYPTGTQVSPSPSSSYIFVAGSAYGAWTLVDDDLDEPLFTSQRDGTLSVTAAGLDMDPVFVNQTNVSSVFWPDLFFSAIAFNSSTHTHLNFTAGWLVGDPPDPYSLPGRRVIVCGYSETTAVGLFGHARWQSIFAGSGAYSNTAVLYNDISNESSNDTTTTVPALPPPENLTATPDLDAINLTWNETTNATGYHVFLNGTLIATTNQTALRVENLTGGATYAFDVTAFNETLESTPAHVLGTPLSLCVASMIFAVNFTGLDSFFAMLFAFLLACACLGLVFEVARRIRGSRG